MKETTHVVNKIMNNYKSLSLSEKEELEELLDMNDQDLFDLIFKYNLNFKKKFQNIKRYVE